MDLQPIRDALKSDVRLDQETHTYWLNGVRLESVSSLLSRFKEPFDAQHWSAVKARQRGITAEEMRSEWKAKSDLACELGSEVHQFIQFWIACRGCDAAAWPRLGPFQAWWTRVAPNVEPVGAEIILHDLDTLTAGTTDLIVWSRKSELFHVLDWKTNREFRTTNRWGKTLLPPFEFLADCHLSTYSLQVWRYTAMAEKLTGEPFGDPWIIHIGDRVTVHRALPLRETWRRHLTTPPLRSGCA